MFRYFWYTKDSIPDGVGMGLFSFTHIVEIILAGLILCVLVMWFKRCDKKQRERFLLTVVILLWIDEFIKHIGSAAIGQWEVGYLPFHICSINIFLSTLYYFKRSKVLAQILYCLGVPGAFMALLLPTWSKLPVMNFMHLHSYTIHILLMLFPILLVVNGERPNIRYHAKCCLVFVCYSLPIFFLNHVLDTDFIFLNGAKGTPFTGLVKSIGNPLYCVFLILIIFALMALMYVPWVVYDKKKMTVAV